MKCYSHYNIVLWKNKIWFTSFQLTGISQDCIQPQLVILPVFGWNTCLLVFLLSSPSAQPHENSSYKISWSGCTGWPQCKWSMECTQGMQTEFHICLNQTWKQHWPQLTFLAFPFSILYTKLQSTSQVDSSLPTYSFPSLGCWFIVPPPWVAFSCNLCL